MWCRKQPPQQIHHIDGNRRNSKRDNLIALCGTCHVKATAGEITKEQFWKRLGIKKKTKKISKKRRKSQTPLERLAKQIQKDF
jgi:5-methylcytosine-specific restriction endonuclease McrA